MNLELREKVARLVMGLSHVQRVGVLSPYFVFDNGMTAQAVPRYETDIAAAWQVVEKMRERGFKLLLTQPNPAQWDAIFYPWESSEDEEWPCSEFIETAPLAICLAAVTAIEPEARDAKA